MTHYLERDWCRDRLIRNRHLIRACAQIVGWWPHGDRYWVAKSLERDLGLNEAEFIEVRIRANVLDNNGAIDHSDEALGRYLDTITAAEEIALVPRDRVHVILEKVLTDHGLIEHDDLVDRVGELVIFFWGEPTPWMIQFEAGREERRAWRAARAAAR